MVTYSSGTERSIWTWSHSIETCLLSYCIKTSSFLPELKFYFWILRSFFLGGVTFTWLRAAHEIIFITYNVKKFNMQIHWPVKRNIFNRNECIFLPLNQHLPPTEIRTTTCTSFHGGVKLYGAFSSQEWF